MPNPRDANSGAAGSHYHGKLSGDYHWPFSISLPKEVTLADPARKHGAVQTYRLPQTFLERTMRASVYYELCVHIARSTFRVDNKYVCPINLPQLLNVAWPDCKRCSSTSLPYDQILPHGSGSLRTGKMDPFLVPIWIQKAGTRSELSPSQALSSMPDA
jgi:hypothetical protein